MNAEKISDGLREERRAYSISMKLGLAIASRDYYRAYQTLDDPTRLPDPGKARAIRGLMRKRAMEWRAANGLLKITIGKGVAA